jgi:hypothetical protein
MIPPHAKPALRVRAQRNGRTIAGRHGIAQDPVHMESSTVLIFRIFVMLSCLLIVPMAAIFGSAFPDVVKSVLVDRIMHWATGKAPQNKPTGTVGAFGTVGPAPHDGAPAVGADATEAPRWGAPGNAATWQSQDPDLPHGPVVPAAAGLTDPAIDNQQAGYVVPAGTAPYPSATGDSAYAATAPDALAAAPSQPRDGPQPSGLPPSGAAPLAAQADPFTVMEQKLREYGATYYLLETWGNNGELFRFHCKMAIGKNSHYTRHFEATDRDALRAMNQVLERVEAWRAGPGP